MLLGIRTSHRRSPRRPWRQDWFIPRRPAEMAWGERRRGFRRPMGTRSRKPDLSLDWFALRKWEDDGGGCYPASEAAAGGASPGRAGARMDRQRAPRASPGGAAATEFAEKGARRKTAHPHGTSGDDLRRTRSVDARMRAALRAKSSRLAAHRAALRRAKLAERWTVYTLAGIIVVATAPFVLLVALLLACVGVYRRVAALMRTWRQANARPVDRPIRDMPPVGFEPTLEGF